MKKELFLFTVLALSMATSAVAFAQPSGANDCYPRGSSSSSIDGSAGSGSIGDMGADSSSAASGSSSPGGNSSDTLSYYYGDSSTYSYDGRGDDVSSGMARNSVGDGTQGDMTGRGVGTSGASSGAGPDRARE